MQESFRLLGDIYQLDAATYRRTFDDLVEVLDLAPLLSVPARQLSLGQRMRCDLAASLVHSPPVLYLDKPSIGLGVSVKARFREFIRTMHRERGLTVMLTSHDLGDIEELCERLVMIDQGRIVYDGALEQVTDRFGWERSLRLTLSEPSPHAAERARTALSDRRGTTVSQPSDTVLAIACDGRQITSGVLIRDLATQVPMADIEIQQPSAESIIRQLYEGTLRLDEGPEGVA